MRKNKKYWKQQAEYWQDRYIKMLKAYGKLDEATNNRPYPTIGNESEKISKKP